MSRKSLISWIKQALMCVFTLKELQDMQRAMNAGQLSNVFEDALKFAVQSKENNNE